MSLYNQIVLGCSLFELLWIRYTYELMLAMWLLRHSTIHHGCCSRRTSELLIHVKCVDAVELAFTATMVIPAGDFNTLPQDDGMTVNWSMECISSIIVSQPVRGVNKLDRMYVSKLIYTYYIIFSRFHFCQGCDVHGNKWPQWKFVIAYTPIKTADKT